MAIRQIGDVNTTGTIQYNIVTDLADNNAGNISARDVRQNILDLAQSVIPNVSSGDFFATYPFVKNIRIKKHLDPNEQTNTGSLIVESGIKFDNGVANENDVQVVPYPGPENIDHADLRNLTDGNPHPQYLPVSGGIIDGNLGVTSGHWINSRGNNIQNSIGLRFEQTDLTSEDLHVGSNTTVVFDKDSSFIDSALGVAKAFINFSATASLEDELNDTNYIQVKSAYNISTIERVEENGEPQRGKFKVYFTNGLFDSANDYAVVGLCNARNSNANGSDFDINTVGIVERTSSYFTFYVLDRDANYIDAEVNDIVVFGSASGVTNQASSVTKRIGPA